VTRRFLRLAALAALIALPLSACRSQVGTAAFVGDHRITIEDVQSGVDDFYADPVLAKAGAGREALVRQRTLNAMILLDLFKLAAKNEGATVSAAQKKETEAAYKQNPGQIPGPLQGAPTRIAAETGAYATALQAVATRTAGNEQDANGKFNAAIEKAAKQIKIDVNPRFGSFDVKTFLQTFSIGTAKDKAVIDLPNPNQQPEGQPGQAPPEGQPGQAPPEGQPGEAPPEGQPPAEEQPS
jgi:hypothetical protein